MAKKRQREMLSLKKSRVTSQGKCFIRQYQAENRICPLPTNVWQAPFLANFVSRRCIRSYLSNYIFPSSLFSLPLPFFSSLFYLSTHSFIYFHAGIKYARTNILISLSIFRGSFCSIGGGSSTSVAKKRCSNA